MPPKKLSKKELERKKKEEEERKKQEEEEQRLKAEQEEKERIHREKIEAEERKKVEKQELKKRSVELDDFRVFIGEIENSLIEYEIEFRQQYAWNRYLRCDGSPDPSILQEINTYMNLWREDDSEVSIVPIMNEASLCLALIEELEFLMRHYSNEESFERQLHQYNETAQELQVLLQEKIDRTSLEMLSQASLIKEKDDNNLTQTWTFRNIVLCLWANLSKKPKFAEFKFPTIGMTFSIPRVLIQFDLGFRVLFTKYDHYSGLCKHFYAHQKEIVKEETVETSVVNAEGELNEGDENKEAENDEVEELSAEEPEPISLMDELSKAGLDDGDEKEETIQEQEEEVDPPPEDSVPTPIPPEWEDFDGNENVLDLRAVSPIGGLFQINMVYLPPQPKSANEWLMTHQVVPPQLTAFPYDLAEEAPNEALGASSYSTMKRNSSMDFERDTHSATIKEKGGLRPVPIILKLPDNVIVAEEPQLALWDTTNNVWKTGDVVITEYKESERLIYFQMLKFGVLGIFQDFHANMPFQSWTIRPFREVFPDVSIEDNTVKSRKSVADLSQPHKDSQAISPPPVNEYPKTDYEYESKYQCLLVITAAIFEVKLHICNDKIRILPDKERPELNALADNWYDVSNLIKIMREAGINIFPREDSPKYVSITDKNRIAEQRLYDQMALLSPSMAFGGSRWNAESKNPSTIIVLASEHLHVERTVNEDDWSVLSFTRKKVEKLKMSEFDEAFSTEKDERVDFHSNLYHYYENVGSEEGMIPIKSIDIHYYDTVRNLLNSIRPVVFS